MDSYERAFLSEFSSLEPNLFLKRLFIVYSKSIDKEIILFLNKFIYLIYLFLAVLGLRCRAQAFSSCCKRGLLFVAVRGLLIAVASLIADHGL